MALPNKIGNYRITKTLGSGSYGTVKSKIKVHFNKYFTYFQ